MIWPTEYVVPALALLSGLTGLLFLRSSLRKKEETKETPLQVNARHYSSFSRVTKVY